MGLTKWSSSGPDTHSMIHTGEPQITDQTAAAAEWGTEHSEQNEDSNCQNFSA
jgi:hypothetical protein